MIELKRRCLSPIIATVLLLMITVASISIIAGFLIPFVKNSLKGTSCVKYVNYFSFDDGFPYNCYDTNSQHGVSVRAGDNGSLSENVRGFDLIFSREGSSVSVKVRGGADGVCLVNGISMLGNQCSITPIIIPGPGETYTYVYNVTADFRYESVKVRPVIEQDGSENTCSESDSIDLKACDSGVYLRR